MNFLHCNDNVDARSRLLCLAQVLGRLNDDESDLHTRNKWAQGLMQRPAKVEDKNNPELRIGCDHSPDYLRACESLWKRGVVSCFDACNYNLRCGLLLRAQVLQLFNFSK